MTIRAPVRDAIADTASSSAFSTARPSSGKRLDELALGLRDRGSAAELAEMGGARR